MGKHPFNLGLRFILEMMALFSIAFWGWSQHSGWLKYSLAAGLPIIMALIWGIFAVPNDPSRSGKTVVPTPGWIRFILELVIFGIAVWAFYTNGYPYVGLLFMAFVILHYAFSIGRIKWLFGQ